MRRPRHASFPEALDASLQPLLRWLQNLDSLVAELEPGVVEGAVSSLSSGRSRIATALADALRRRPQVVLSGPPKSGKSTLAAGLSRDLVTKVTTLPTLVAPVRIAHARAWSLWLERHDGTQERFGEPKGARLEVQAGLRAWSEGLRLAEQHGEPFRPERHALRATAAVDVGAPARGLADSGLALVELPHLGEEHALVRARYRERFDEAVSVHVVVVRGEDLCRPELLRPYEVLIAPGRSAQLVLNVDPRKLGLASDGTERSSSDEEDPVAVIEAFRSLGASRAWLAAFDEGRLRVQVLALHELAVARLTGARGSRRPQAAGVGPGSAQALAAFEHELDAYLHDETRWREHVRGTLAELDGALASLQRGFDHYEPAGAPESFQSGLRGLERALEGLRGVRARHLAS